MKLVTRYRDRRGRWAKFRKGRVLLAEYYEPSGPKIFGGVYKKRKKPPVKYVRIVEEEPAPEEIKSIVPPGEKMPTTLTEPKIAVVYEGGRSARSLWRGSRTDWNIIRVKYRVVFQHPGYRGRSTTRWFSTVRDAAGPLDGFPSRAKLDYIRMQLSDLYEGYRLKKERVKKIVITQIWTARI